MCESLHWPLEGRYRISFPSGRRAKYLCRLLGQRLLSLSSSQGLVTQTPVWNGIHVGRFTSLVFVKCSEDRCS